MAGNPSAVAMVIPLMHDTDVYNANMPGIV